MPQEAGEVPAYSMQPGICFQWANLPSAPVGSNGSEAYVARAVPPFGPIALDEPRVLAGKAVAGDVTGGTAIGREALRR